MKIAGRKNDGAWFRTNKWLERQPADFKTRLKADTDLLAAATIVYGVMGSLAGTQSLGTVGVENLPTTAALLLAQWVDTGIPRQVYMGTLSWDNYAKVAPGGQIPGTNKMNGTGKDLYVPENKANMATAGAQIRSKLNKHRLVTRQLTDIANTVSDRHLNPGGIADGDKNT